MSVNNTPRFDGKDVILHRKTTTYNGFFKINEYQLSHRLFLGEWSKPINREVFERGDAAVLLPYDPVRDEVVLIEQFRVGAYVAQQRDPLSMGPWQVECIAGMVDKGRTPAEVAIAEAQEEAGLTISGVHQVMRFLSSPGGMSEQIYLFVATVDSTDISGVYGLADENEDIKVHVVDRKVAMQWLEDGRIENGTTIIALQWLQLNLAKWRK